MRDSTMIYTAEQLQELLQEAERLQEYLGCFRAAIAVKEQARGLAGMGPLSGFLYPVDILLTGFAVACQSMLAERLGDAPAGSVAERPRARHDA